MNDLEDIRWKEASNNPPDLNKREQEIPSVLEQILKKLFIWIFMFVFCYCTIPYCISWIHELSHAITAIMNGFKVTNIEVSWPHGGSTTLQFESPFLTGDEVKKYSLVLVAGSIGAFCVSLGLTRIIYHIKKVKFIFFLPIFITLSHRMLYEIKYWIDGINYWREGILVVHDSAQLLNINSNINPLGLLIFLICLMFLIIIWLLINLVRDIFRRYAILKEKVQLSKTSDSS